MDDIDLRAIAATQGHVFTRRDASHLSDEVVEWRLAKGVWTRLARGVYAETAIVEEVADDPLRRHALDIAAERIRRQRTTVISHESAARFQGLALLRPEERTPRLTSRHGAPLKTKDVEIDVADYSERDVFQVDGAPGPVLSVARTVVDLARERPFHSAVVTADSALHLELCGRAELDAVLELCSGWPGIVAAREAIAFADKRAESALESLARVGCLEGALPTPVPQLWIPDEKGFLFARADLGWEQERTILEADGKVKYKGVEPSPIDPLVLEKIREAKLRDLGWEVERVMWEEAMFDRIAMAARVRRAFARAARHHAA